MQYGWPRTNVWWQAFRYYFVPPSFLPAMLGGIIAWAIAGEFHWEFYLITVIGVTLNHIALNMTDDYYDYINSVDRAGNHGRNPYSGGSGTLTLRLIRPDQMRTVFLSGYLITIILGLYLTFMRSPLVLGFGLFGMGCAYFYTAPPIRYGYYGFGELSQLINFSFTIGMGAYFVQALAFSWETFWAVLPLGFIMFSMIIINEIPDYDEDKSGGKRTLVVIWGKNKAVWLYAAGLTSAFFIILITPILNLTTYWIYLSLSTIPWGVRAIRVAFRRYQTPVALAPANLLTIRIHNLGGILLFLGYLLHGIQMGRDTTYIWIPVLVLIILYFPVAGPIFFKRRVFMQNKM